MRRLSLAWSGDGRDACLLIRGWRAEELRALAACPPAELSRRLAVLPQAALDAGIDLSGLQPLPGRFAVEGDAISFHPRFPFVDGTRYVLLVHPAAAGEQPERWTIERPRPPQAAVTEVVEIYPTAAALPVNLLKLYVQFSAPMSEGWAAGAVRVRRASDGAPLAGVFLASETELWDREHRRLTLLLDPGRIKRGLVPNAEAGYPLVEGVPIAVSVEPAFRDAAGRPLRSGFERCYAVGPPLRARVDPRAWRLDVPRAGTGDPLSMTFDRPLDRALLERCLWVHDADGAPLDGHATVAARECGWRFAPRQPWAPGVHDLIVDPRIEDLAGNALTRVFDRDLVSDADEPVAPRPVALPFTCHTGMLARATMHPSEGAQR